MAVNFSGITSGIDTKAIIDATINAQRVPITKLNQKKSDWQTQISNLGKLASKIDELKTMMTDMKEMGKVLATKATVTDEAFATVSVDGAAVAGHYDFTVSQLARAEKDRSAAFNSDFSEVKAGTLTLQTPDKDPVEIKIEEGDTLDDVVDKINASTARVDATIVRDGSKSYLQLVASDAGHAIGGVASDAIKITESYTGTSGTELGLTEVVQAKNAKVNIDGLDIEARSNTIADKIPGVTLNLKKEGTTALDVATNNDGTKDKLKGFVTKLNEVLSLIKSQTKTSDNARTLEPDPAVERIGRELRSLVSNPVTGVAGTYPSLASVGIKTTTTSTFEIDTTALDKALANDPRSIAKLFTQADTGVATRLETALKSYTDPIDGIIGSRKKALGVRVSDTDEQVARMEARLTTLQASMQRQFTKMEQALTNFQTQTRALTGITS